MPEVSGRYFILSINSRVNRESSISDLVHSFLVGVFANPQEPVHAKAHKEQRRKPYQLPITYYL
jgi:hypothetical protein